MIGLVLTALFFIFPGAHAVFRRDFFPQFTMAEKIPLVIALSLSYWIIGFWLLKYIPLPLHVFLFISLGLSIAVFLVRSYRRLDMHSKFFGTIRTNGPVIIWFFLLSVPAIMLAARSIAPSGADMSMHAYLAKIIYLADSFPKTMMPIAPIAQFGKYPIGFSILVADMMVINRLPVYTNALWLAAFTYWFFAASVYILLRTRFTPFISIITTILISWAGLTPNDFIEWGANPTILSLDFLIIAAIYYLHLTDAWSPVFLFIILFSSLLTHYIVPVGIGYVSLIFIPILWRRTANQLRRRALVPMMLGCALLTLPFVTHTNWQSWKVSSTTQSFVAGLHAQELREWSRVPPSQPIRRAVDFIVNTYGVPLSGVYGLSLLILTLLRQRSMRLHAAFMLGVLMLIINAEYWWLPFSPILYPKRVALLLVIPMSFAIAQALSLTVSSIYTHIIIHTNRNRAVLYGLVSILIGYIFYPGMQMNFRRFINAKNLSVVTHEDIDAMKWITGNTPKDAVILNNYTDAGLWIPAIAERQITLYHTNPIDMDHFTGNQGRESYAYIGNKTLTGAPDIDTVNTASLSENPDYTLVYENNRAAIYRVNASK